MGKLRRSKLVGKAYAIRPFQWARRRGDRLPGVSPNGWTGCDAWLARRSGAARLLMATGTLSATALVAGGAVVGFSERSPVGSIAAAEDATATPAQTIAESTEAAAATAIPAAPTATSLATPSPSPPATATPATVVATTTPALAPTATAPPDPEPFDRLALLEALPTPDDAWFEENPDGIDQVYSTGMVGPTIIAVHDDWLRDRGWKRVEADASLAHPNARWLSGGNEVVVELESAGNGRVRVSIRVRP